MSVVCALPSSCHHHRCVQPGCASVSLPMRQRGCCSPLPDPSVPAVCRLQHGRVLPSSGEEQVRDHGFRQLAAGGSAQPASVTALTLEEYLNTSVKALPICLRFQRNYSVYGKRERERARARPRERDCCPLIDVYIEQSCFCL